MYSDWHLCDAVPHNCGAKKTETRTKHIEGVVRNRLNLADRESSLICCPLISSTGNKAFLVF